MQLFIKKKKGILSLLVKCLQYIFYSAQVSEHDFYFLGTLYYWTDGSSFSSHQLTPFTAVTP